MTCPNCGLANPDNAKFCGNCGTSFSNVPPPSSGQYQTQSQGPQAPGPYRFEGAGANRGGNSVAKNIGLGCLIAVIIFMVLGLSCTRACFGHRRAYYHPRY
jgi:uncharacterized membrane protein YvbJ